MEVHMLLKRILIIPLLWLIPTISSPLSPMSGFSGLIAGEGSPGCKDGPFYSALFKSPHGLAIEPSGGKLYVADQENNCIRVVDLENANQVSTLVGQVKGGYADGSFSQALFNQPSLVVYLHDQQLAVYDSGNNRIRLVDLRKKTVTTIAGNGKRDMSDRDAPEGPVGFIWSMAYLDSDDSLYFTEPEFGTMRKLDFKTAKITVQLKGRAETPNPLTLCAWNGKLYVGDRYLKNVYQFEQGPGGTASLKLYGDGDRIIGLVGSGKTLYALQAIYLTPLKRLGPKGGQVQFWSAWGRSSPTWAGCRFSSRTWNRALMTSKSSPIPGSSGNSIFPTPTGGVFLPSGT